MLDTNICTHQLKHQPPEVAERFSACFVGDLVISANILAELEHGVTCSGEDREHNARALAAFLVEVPAVLVANTKADFSAFPGLKLENWVGEH
jgi:tRNA(fMet)-specific endonuclease VapC